jgi:hypothetical protein
MFATNYLNLLISQGQSKISLISAFRGRKYHMEGSGSPSNAGLLRQINPQGLIHDLLSTHAGTFKALICF